MVRQIRRGYDGIDEDPNRVRWTIPSALMYCITIYTTIGSLFFAFCLCLFSFLNNFCPFFRFFFFWAWIWARRDFFFFFTRQQKQSSKTTTTTQQRLEIELSLFSLSAAVVNHFLISQGKAKAKFLCKFYYFAGARCNEPEDTSSFLFFFIVMPKRNLFLSVDRKICRRRKKTGKSHSSSWRGATSKPLNYYWVVFLSLLILSDGPTKTLTPPQPSPSSTI